VCVEILAYRIALFVIVVAPYLCVFMSFLLFVIGKGDGPNEKS